MVPYGLVVIDATHIQKQRVFAMHEVLTLSGSRKTSSKRTFDKDKKIQDTLDYNQLGEILPRWSKLLRKPKGFEQLTGKYKHPQNTAFR